MSVVDSLAVVFAVAALLAATVLLLRRRLARRLARRPRRAKRLRYPLVLAHGLLGFRELRIAGARHEYFRGVPNRLRGLGAEVYAFGVSPTASVEVRARQLAQAVAGLDARRVNIVAHSMGGLDARFAVARLGLERKVASLTTVGTPHHGTPLADLGVDLLGGKLGLLAILERLGVPVEAFYDLTTSRMARFNQVVPDARGVSYGCVVGRHRGPVNVLSAPLVPSYLFLSERAGENDGLVPASSQAWGEVLKTIEADHWAQVGWSVRFDAPGFYAELIRELVQRGF